VVLLPVLHQVQPADLLQGLPVAQHWDLLRDQQVDLLQVLQMGLPLVQRQALLAVQHLVQRQALLLALLLYLPEVPHLSQLLGLREVPPQPPRQVQHQDRPRAQLLVPPLDLLLVPRQVQQQDRRWTQHQVRLLALLLDQRVALLSVLLLVLHQALLLVLHRAQQAVRRLAQRVVPLLVQPLVQPVFRLPDQLVVQPMFLLLGLRLDLLTVPLPDQPQFQPAIPHLLLP
jgi:hypothetical protein